VVTYWDKQTRIDVTGALALTLILWLGPKLGLPKVFEIGSPQEVGRAWLSPILALLGMMSATTAFIFTVVDRSEFKIIRGNHAESQLWRIFAQNIGWLAISAAYCALITFAAGAFANWILPVGTFLIVLVTICVLKFAWVMRQVIFVRIDQTREP
jgi:hypothetical protein